MFDILNILIYFTNIFYYFKPFFTIIIIHNMTSSSSTMTSSIMDINEMFDLYMNLNKEKEKEKDKEDAKPYTQNKFLCECDEMYKIIDTESGDVICSNCGLVLEERVMQFQDEFDANDNFISIQSSKNAFFENTMMSTIISKSKSKSKLKNIGLMNTLHIQTSVNQRESYRNKEFCEVERLCADLKTTANVATQAKHYFHDLCKIKVFRGVNRKAMMACCIIRSFSTNKINRTVTEICDAVNVSKHVFTKNLKKYETLMKVKLFNERTTDEIYRHLQLLGVKDEDVFKMSNMVIEKQKEMLRANEFQGKSPKVLLAIILRNMGFDKRKICTALTVSITAF